MMKSRPPNAPYKVKEMIKLGLYDEAQAACDENVEFYRAKITDQQDLFLDAQAARMGVTRHDELKDRYGPAMRNGAES